MISEDDYRRFVQPFIREQCQKIDYTLYHLDGVGAMHHLPALLEIEELNAIQWTPGVGEPQGGSPKWYDLYKKILTGGKSIMACWVTLDELKPLLDNIGADGVHLEMDFHNEQEVEQAMRIVEEYSSSSPAASKESLSKEEAAATKQETIIIKSPEAAEDEALKPLFNAIVDGKLEPAVEVTKKGHSRRHTTPRNYQQLHDKGYGRSGTTLPGRKSVRAPTADGRTRHEGSFGTSETFTARECLDHHRQGGHWNRERRLA